jgi:hypothetical protein
MGALDFGFGPLPRAVDVNNIEGPIGIDPNTGGQAIIVSVGALLGATAAALLRRTASDAQTQQQTVAGTNAIIPIIYGRRRVGAKIGAVTVAGGNLYVLAVWCLGEIEEIEQTFIDDAGLPAGVLASHHYGTQTQGVDPLMQAAYAALGQTYSDTLAGICYSVFMVPPKTSGGFPRLTATIKGLKVSTSSGGPKVYSDNPAYIIADFIESPTYGMGRAVDWTTVASVAALCDQTLDDGSKRRVLSVSLDSAQECRAWLDTLRDYAGCWIIPEGSTYRLVPDAAVTLGGMWGSTLWASGLWASTLWAATGAGVAAAFDASNIVAQSFRKQKRGTRTQPTVVEVTYTDVTVTPWRDRTVTVYAPGVLAGTTARRVAKIPKPGITTYAQAYRYAIERLNGYLLNDESVQFQSFDPTVAVRAGDVVSVTYSPKGINAAKYFRLLKAEPVSAKPNLFAVNAEEYDPAKYSTVVVTGPTYPDTNLDDPVFPPAVNSLAVVEEVYFVQSGLYASRLRITWSEPSYSAVDGYQIEVLQAGARIEVGNTHKGTAEYVTGALKENLLYTINVYVLSTVGAKGTPATVTITNNGKLARPSDVPFFEGFEVGGEVRLHWTPATDVDLTAHEIRYGAIGGTWDTATLINRIGIPAVRYETRIVPAGLWRFWIKGLDSVRTNPAFPYGQESVNAISVDIEVTSDENAFVATQYSFASPTLFNVSAQPAGWVTDFGDTWGALFPNALSTYTNALLTYHSAGTSLLVDEVYDFGVALTGTWSGSMQYQNLIGTANLFLDLLQATDGANTLTAASNATPIVITSTAHGYTTGDEVVVQGVVGNPAANGRWLITVIDADHFSLQTLNGANAAGSGAYTSGGTATRWNWLRSAVPTVKTAARYARLRIYTTGTMLITGLGSVQCDVVARSEASANPVTTLASGPLIISLTNHYNKATHVDASLIGTVGGQWRYDMVEVSAGGGIGAPYALRTDGIQNYIDIPGLASWNPGAGPITIEFLLSPRLTGVNEYRCPMAKWNWGTASAWAVQVHQITGQIFFNVAANTNDTSGNQYVYTGGGLLSNDKWRRISIVYDGAQSTNLTKILIYVDGVLQNLGSVGAIPASIPNGAANVQLGRFQAFPASNQRSLAGAIDDVRFWTVARTPAQIAAALVSELTGGETGLLAYYRMNEGTGTSTADATGHGNTGTLTGTPKPLWRPYDGFDLYAFDASGAQIATQATWKFFGV